MNIQISGNLSKPTIIFIAGWPDTSDVFRDNLMAALASDFRIVGLTLPGFDDEHPFFQELRERWAVNQSGKRGQRGRDASSHSKTTAFSRLCGLWPFRILSSTSVGGSLPHTGSARGAVPLQSLGVPHHNPLLEPFNTTWKGHSFQDLVALLEIAVDTAMETCNFCPDVVLPATDNHPATQASHAGEDCRPKTAGGHLDAVSAHQMPNTHLRPTIIAHDWGCMLAYELFLARPSLFSRMVALDVGGYVFERDATHVEWMCSLLAGRQPGGKLGGPANSSSTEVNRLSALVAPGRHTSPPPTFGHARAEERVTLPSVVSYPSKHPSISATSQSTWGDSAPKSPVTVAHGVSASVEVDCPRAVASLHRPSSPPAHSKRRSLASQYAIRRRRNSKPAQRADLWKGLFIVTYQFFLIVCDLFIPRRLAQWLLGCLVRFAGRPSYSYDPQIVANPTMEVLNHSINADFYALHPFAVENRVAVQASLPAQTWESKGSPQAPAFPSVARGAGGDDSWGRPRTSSQHSWKGLKIVLVAYTEKSPNQSLRRREVRSGHPVGKSPSLFMAPHQHLDTDGKGEGLNRVGKSRRRGFHSGRSRRHSLFEGLFSEDSSVSNSADDHPLRNCDDVGDGGGAIPQGDFCERKGSLDGGRVVSSSYTKGADLPRVEAEGMGVGAAGYRSGVGCCGEMDPYTGASDEHPPWWVTDDPLALTGAKSFQRSNPTEGEPDEKTSFRMEGYAAPPRDLWPEATEVAPGCVQRRKTRKRRIFYQAVVFPAVAHTAPASQSCFSDDAEESTSGRGVTRPRSTVASILRRPSCLLSLHPSVPVRAIPLQGWIYLRYWSGVLLLYVVAVVMWLLGEKPRASPANSTSKVGFSPSNTEVAGGKFSSNVMTTAMTTIYRRLPTKPLLAADVTTLPGNREAMPPAKSYAPLVSQRFFVPLPIPILFMYGGGKHLMFHSDHWCSYIRQYQRPRDGISDVVEVQGGGHWFFAEKKYQKKVADRIIEFLKAEPQAPWRA